MLDNPDQLEPTPSNHTDSYTLPLYDPNYKQVVGTCKECGGSILLFWRSKLSLSEYSCSKCGRTSTHMDGVKKTPTSILQETFDSIYNELVSSGIPHPRAITVCKLTMHQLHIPEFKIKSLEEWGYTTDPQGRLHKYVNRKIKPKQSPTYTVSK